MVLGLPTGIEFSRTVRAVVIGVGEVAGGWLEALPAPEREAAAVAAALTDPDGCAVPAEQVTCITGAVATREACLQAISEAAQALEARDSLILYFAGHGLTIGEDFKLCTSDALGQSLATTTISGADLEALLGAVDCRGILVVLDCCEGGGFASRAPNMFRELRAGEYRILLASARDGQKSWEAPDGSGTLFARHFLAVLTGEARAGNVPGAIYFSDLVATVDAGIRESLRDKDVGQDLLLAAVYTRDPLILVHRSLSLEQVQFATARFSPAYVRRTLLRGAAALTFIAFFGATAAYGILDSSQFVREEGERLVIYKGDPAWNLPGYPRRIWTLSQGKQILAEPLPDDALVVRGGGTAIELVERNLRPDYGLALLASAGEHSRARSLALQMLRSPDLQFEQRLAAQLVFPTVAVAGDNQVLTQLLGDDRSEVRLAALQGLMRLDPAYGFGAAAALVEQRGGQSVQTDVVRRLEVPCSPPVARYLEGALTRRGGSSGAAEILDAALRVRCRLDDRALQAGLSSFQYSDGRDLAHYARIVGSEDALAEAAVTLLRGAAGNSLTRSAVPAATLASVSRAPCPLEFLQSARSSYERLALMIASARHCRGHRLVAASDRNSRAIGIAVTTGAEPITVSVVPLSSRGEVDLRLLLELLPEEMAGPIALVLADVLGQVANPSLQAEVLKLLVRTGTKARVPWSWLDGNSIDLREGAAAYLRNEDPRRLAAELIRRLGNRDLFYTEMLGSVKLTAAELDDVRKRTDDRVDEQSRSQAACVLAMQDEPRAVLRLLTSPDASIRGAATDCAPFNKSAPVLAERLPARVNGFPLEGRDFLQEQTRRKSKLVAQLAGLSRPLRVWRLSIVNSTGGGFGLWGRGMRAWLKDEQHKAA